MYKHIIGASFLLSTSMTQAAYVYEFSGTIPNDAPTLTHPSISAGETWVTRFEFPSLIEACNSCTSWNQIDQDFSGNKGLYILQVEQVTITFSGGFVGYIEIPNVSEPPPPISELTVWDNVYEPLFDREVDAVFFEMEDFPGSPTSNFLSVLAVTDDLSSISRFDDAIDDPPPPGTSIVPSGLPGNFLQFSYGDANGTVTYGGLQDYNVSLTVSAIPLPAAVWLFGSGLIVLVGAARRKKA